MSLNFLHLWVYNCIKFGKLFAIISSNMFSLPSFQNFNHICIKPLEIVPQFSDALLFLFLILFSLCDSFWIVLLGRHQIHESLLMQYLVCCYSI